MTGLKPPRLMTPDDVPQMAQWAEPKDIATLNKLITLPAFRGVVLDDGAQCIGFTYGWRVGDDVEIIQITVHPDHRRKGHGRILLEEFIDGVGATICRLEVRADNTAARALYERFGFIQDGIRANYYDDDRGRSDAVLMSYHRDQHQEN